jgi:carbamoyl-phosphate synthase large subunit
MEFLPGKEYSVDVLSSKQSVYAVVPRSRDLIRTGITFNGTVQKRDDIIEYSKKIVAETGLEFACGLQFKDDCEGVPKIIESNPRIQGTMVLSTLAGANIIYGAAKLALKENVPQFSIRWGTKLFRYWGGIGKNGKVSEI